MDKAWYPAKTIVPSTEIVQDRTTLELFRGCIRGCRFCQAGYVYRPVRNRSEPSCWSSTPRRPCEDSGYEEMTLSSPLDLGLSARSLSSATIWRSSAHSVM